jgi:hypothetical protein
MMANLDTMTTQAKLRVGLMYWTFLRYRNN